MLPVLLVLLIGVMAYLWWRWRFTSLTRECRWREARDTGGWWCAYCGARASGARPRVCLRERT